MAKEICARDLQPGLVLIDRTGDRRSVVDVRPNGALISNPAVSPKTAAAIEVTLSGDLKIIVHPAQPLIIA